MIETPRLLDELQQKQIVLSVTEQGKLSFIAPENAMTPELTSAIKEHKAALIHLLTTRQEQEQKPEPHIAVVEDTAPLICRKCHSTHQEDFKPNIAGTRWICCNCGTPSRRIYPPTIIELPEPASPGVELEQLRKDIGTMVQALYGQEQEASSTQEHTDERNTDELEAVKAAPVPVPAPKKQKQHSSIGTSHAVLTDTHIVWCETTSQGRKVQKQEVEAPEHIGDVCTLATEHGFTHVWIMPGTELSKRATRDFLVSAPADTWDVFSAPWNEEKQEPLENEYPVFARIWRKNTSGQAGRKVQVGFPEYGTWEWIADSPVTILATIDYLERVLGVPVEWSTGHIGTALVKHLNKKANRQEWTRDTTIDLMELPFKKSARDLAWIDAQYTVTSDEPLYIHEYDKNSEFLSVCPGLTVGAGDPVHLTDCSNCDTSLPGIYRVTATSGVSPFNGDTLPLLTNTEWVTSDMLTYALTLGYEVTVHECYQWEEKHRTLESFATTLWNARKTLKTDVTAFPHTQGRENAYETIKQIALKAVGRFAYEKSSQFLRPDWWACVVGKARTNMFRKLNELQLVGFKPVLIYHDALYFISSDRNPVTAIPGLMKRATELGGFKHEATWLVTPELIEKLHTLTPGKVQTWLKNEAERYEG